MSIPRASQGLAILSCGFRPFFLLGSIYGRCDDPAIVWRVCGRCGTSGGPCAARRAHAFRASASVSGTRERRQCSKIPKAAAIRAAKCSKQDTSLNQPNAHPRRWVIIRLS
jgi:hypothetical protein